VNDRLLTVAFDVRESGAKQGKNLPANCLDLCTAIAFLRRRNIHNLRTTTEK